MINQRKTKGNRFRLLQRERERQHQFQLPFYEDCLSNCKKIRDEFLFINLISQTLTSSIFRSVPFTISNRNSRSRI